jgi:SAM-dependent methyltransferase
MDRRPQFQELTHERLGDRFADALSTYDTQRRVDVLVDEFLTDDMIAGRRVLDVGCGLGFFSERLVQRGAIVTACDVGPGLVEKTKTRARCEAVVADALRLADTFGANQFDAVVSSECIEHTPSPADALKQMVAVVKPGGVVAVSTPNRLWQPVVRLASLLKLRPFDGYENFSTWNGIRRAFHGEGADVIAERGLHLFPFQFGLHQLSAWSDRHLQIARPLMINVCVLAKKQPLGASALRESR